jgi:hypothetical protein
MRIVRKKQRASDDPPRLGFGLIEVKEDSINTLLSRKPKNIEH